MEKCFILPNRYGDINKLICIDKNNYKLVLCKNAYLSISESDGNIIFIDPSGGPLLTKGYKINDKYIINNISRNDKDYIIELSDE